MRGAPVKEKVFFIAVDDHEDPSRMAKKVKKLYEKCGVMNYFAKGDFVGVKTHFGESSNTTFLHPLIVKAVIDKLKQIGSKPFLTETATLYRGSRSNAIDHIALAAEHGFGIDKIGVPLIMADGLFGDAEVPVAINGRHFDTVKVAREITRVQGIVVLSHFKGHMITGFGGAFKNLGMGLSSRRGKLKQHSVMTPEISSSKCTACGECIKWCPQDTIGMKNGAAFIEKENCIGCGECYAVCKFGAVMIDFQRDSDEIQEMIAEHAAGVVRAVDENLFYFNFLINITQNCDCMNGGQRVSRDIGIVAGRNIVAVEKASCDLFEKENGMTIAQAAHPQVNPYIQLEHACKIGLGSMEYEMAVLEG